MKRFQNLSLASNFVLLRSLYIPVAAVLWTFAPSAWSAPNEARTSFANSIGTLEHAGTMSVNVAPTVRPLAATEMAGTLDFSIALHMRDFAQLQARVARGETISPEEMASAYLPLPEHYASLEKWLQAEGFTIVQEDSSRLSIFVRGTLSQIEKSLQTKVVGVTVRGTRYSTASTAPSLPASLAAPVLGINGLQPYHRLHKHAIVRPAAATAGVTYKINDILTTYDAKSSGVTGKNQTIAILIDTTPSTSDVTSFWTANGVAQTTANVTTINVNNATLPAVSGEETLDVEWSSGIAPGAKIRVYATGTLDDTSLDKGLARIISDVGTDPTIRQLSISLGEGETFESSSQLTTDAQYFATLAGKGVSVFVSSGDGGSTPDDTGEGNEDTGPLQVEYYSSDPSVTGVGGTTLRVTAADVRSSETAWSGSGGGVSIQFAKPAWQTGKGVPTGTKRFVPDVAMPADPNTGAYVFLQGSAQTIGGTSWAAPTWAGFCALAQRGARQRRQDRRPGSAQPELVSADRHRQFLRCHRRQQRRGLQGGREVPRDGGLRRGHGHRHARCRCADQNPRGSVRRPDALPYPHAHGGTDPDRRAHPHPHPHTGNGQVARHQPGLRRGRRQRGDLCQRLRRVVQPDGNECEPGHVFRAVRQRGGQILDRDEAQGQHRGGPLFPRLGKGRCLRPDATHVGCQRQHRSGRRCGQGGTRQHPDRDHQPCQPGGGGFCRLRRDRQRI